MQRVIGGYRTFLEAQRAVRTLERHQFSIQDVLIAEQALATGPRLRATPVQRARWREQSPEFLVALRAEPDVIERATALLLEGTA